MLLYDPPELAESWTVLQAVMWLEMDNMTLEWIALAVREDTDDVTTLAEIWDRLDFCSQYTLTEGMLTFDAECLSDIFGSGD